MLFDLDDTLLDRNKAVDNLFLIVLETCYENVEHLVKKEMLATFKRYDKRSYGYRDKTEVLEAFFDKFPTKHRLPKQEIQAFWNHHFPQCFTVSQETINLVHTLKEKVKIGVITNGTTQRQKAKIRNTNLYHYFDHVFISEEVGFSKPDNRIFESVLNELHMQPEEVLFIGDDIEKDIAGCQNAGIRGIWFNPNKVQHGTDIKPYAEIDELNSVIRHLMKSTRG
ncbi:HAD family hydrolase [Alteribacter aurantiacus]|uniref:HAD family hydrolase n=1 Tax=Alteribacter aurantiacus TaxID=254410 RepID=UPI0004796387|nr:HAD family hydrolase [Alteribacter aurantiacus]